MFHVKQAGSLDLWLGGGQHMRRGAGNGRHRLMRIRRRDKDHLPPDTFRTPAQAPAPAQTTADGASHPTAADPVKTLIAEPPAQTSVPPTPPPAEEPAPIAPGP